MSVKSCLLRLLLLAALPRLPLARNWYWASHPTTQASKCGQLPVAGVSFAMGHVMRADSEPMLREAGWTDDGQLRFEAQLDRCEYFAITTEGMLRGGTSRCSGRYVYGLHVGGVLQLHWLPPPPGTAAANSTSIVLVRGNGFAQTFIRTAHIHVAPAPPPLHPPMAPGDASSIGLTVGTGCAGALILVILASLSYYSARRRCARRQFHNNGRTQCRPVTALRTCCSSEKAGGTRTSSTASRL